MKTKIHAIRFEAKKVLQPDAELFRKLWHKLKCKVEDVNMPKLKGETAEVILYDEASHNTATKETDYGN